jgi:hypothetical protein
MVALTYLGVRVPLVVEMVAVLLFHARPGINSLILHRLLSPIKSRVLPSPALAPIILATLPGRKTSVSECPGLVDSLRRWS